jgi:hypothetical protein
VQQAELQLVFEIAKARQLISIKAISKHKEGND